MSLVLVNSLNIPWDLMNKEIRISNFHDFDLSGVKKPVYQFLLLTVLVFTFIFLPLTFYFGYVNSRDLDLK